MCARWLLISGANGIEPHCYHTPAQPMSCTTVSFYEVALASSPAGRHCRDRGPRNNGCTFRPYSPHEAKGARSNRISRCALARCVSCHNAVQHSIETIAKLLAPAHELKRRSANHSALNACNFLKLKRGSPREANFWTAHTKRYIESIFGLTIRAQKQHQNLHAQPRGKS